MVKSNVVKTTFGWNRFRQKNDSYPDVFLSRSRKNIIFIVLIYVCVSSVHGAVRSVRNQLSNTSDTDPLAEFDQLVVADGSATPAPTILLPPQPNQRDAASASDQKTPTESTPASPQGSQFGGAEQAAKIIEPPFLAKLPDARVLQSKANERLIATLPLEVRNSIIDPSHITEAQLFGSLWPYEQYGKTYNISIVTGHVETIDNPVQELPPIITIKKGREIVLNYTLPDEQRTERVVNNTKIINNYVLQRKFVNVTTRIVNNYKKNLVLNSIDNTNIQRNNHKKTVNVLTNTYETIYQPKLIVRYAQQSQVNEIKSTRKNQTLAKTLEEVQNERVVDIIPPVFEPAQVEVSPPSECNFDSPSLDVDWSIFKQRWRKLYGSFEEEQSRRLQWACNLKGVNDHNSLYNRGHKQFSLAMNQYGDVSSAEFVATYNGAHLPNDDGRGGCDDEVYVNSNKPLPKTVDWRTKNVISAVRIQGDCGSCWAFSAVGAVESHTAIRQNQTVIPLSEQQLVDCSRSEGNNGCNGGYPNHAFRYIVKNSLNAASAYPYVAKNGTCNADPTNTSTTVTQCRNIAQGDELALTDAIAHVGPISVCMDASQTSYQFYQGGVYEEPLCSSTRVDHGLLAVGYGTLGGKEYYLLKNSFGTSWGDNGYMYLARNRDNQCGITNTASYPIVPDKPRPAKYKVFKSKFSFDGRYDFTKI